MIKKKHIYLLIENKTISIVNGDLDNAIIVQMNMYIFDLRACMTENIIWKRPSRSVNSQRWIYRKKFSGGPTEQLGKIITIKNNSENKTDSPCYRKHWWESVEFYGNRAAVCPSLNPVKGLIVVHVCKTGRTEKHWEGNRTRRSSNRIQRVNGLTIKWTFDSYEYVVTLPVQ